MRGAAPSRPPVLLAALLLASAVPVPAAEDPPPPPPAPGAPAAGAETVAESARIDAWVRGVGDPDPEIRRSAARALVERGRAAVAPLRESLEKGPPGGRPRRRALADLLEAGDGWRVGPVPAALRRALGLAPFYGKHLDARGLPVLASGRVEDAALREAKFLVEAMVGHRPEILSALATARVRVVVMSVAEFTADVPEHSDLEPRDHWNRRARGLGATAERPVVSCGEENLLRLAGDPYPGESILVHEFSHAVHGVALARIDPEFDRLLEEAFLAARKRGLWEGTYAGTDRLEYWAEGAQSWFGTNPEPDPSHNHVNTRAELLEYDPGLAALCRRVFAGRDWSYLRPADRVPPPFHLADFVPEGAPRFSWGLLDARK